MTVRTRFAPSPTGFLHIGGARTALFNWLYAKKHNGKYFLRIEDTDKERSKLEYTEDILQSLKWLGIESDIDPIFQSARTVEYKKIIQQLLDSKKAYYCYCTKNRLLELRDKQIKNKQKPRYDGFCRNLSSAPNTDVNPVVRFKNPQEGKVEINDLVRGLVVVQNNELDDLVLARADGSPTYHLTVVVDDINLAITHVIRGDDHLNNTPRQINIYHALGGSLPQYAHIPLIHGKDGKRLSKRHGVVSVTQYQNDGILPSALLNYVIRLGWSHGDKEIFTLNEMIKLFDFSSIQQSPATFNLDKLLWVNHQHMMKTSGKEINKILTKYFIANGINPGATPDIGKLFDVQKERYKNLKDLCAASDYFYKEINGYDEKASKKNFNEHSITVLSMLKTEFEKIDSWKAESIHIAIENVVDELNLKYGKVAPVLRLAVSGRAVSPPIDVTLELLGSDRTVSRIDQAIVFIKSAV